MKTPSRPTSSRFTLSRVLAVGACAAWLLGATCVFAQPTQVEPATITSITQTIPSIAGVPTLLNINGTGYCKYRLTYSKLDGPLSAPPLLVYSSTPQSPFPMHLRILDATPAGTYIWTVVGIEGCTGSSYLTVKVR